MSWIPLPEKFYEPSARSVAKKLLGHLLIRKSGDAFFGGIIVETEAYLKNDPACHGAVGFTPRNKVMWGPPGQAYVYLIYGYHFCVNAVCQRSGVAEAVLIRAIEPSIGVEHLQRNRSVEKPAHLTNGPAKLCQAMNIDRTLDGANLLDSNSPLFIAENPALQTDLKNLGPIITTTRIGISKAAHLPLRFYLQKSPLVSRKERLVRQLPSE
jgi:DNA-3-methyladenine glycosylase